MAVKRIEVNEDTLRMKRGLKEAFEKFKNGILKKEDKYYWHFRENRLKELKEYIDIHGSTEKMHMDNHGKNILRYFSLYEEFIDDALEELGYDINKVMPIKTKGYYRIFDNLKKKINDFIDEYGRFPLKQDFKNVLGISQGLIDYHGGIYEIKRKMNYFDENDLVDDNLFVNSSMVEFMLAQYLIYNKVNYTREKFIDDKRNYRTDFYLTDNDIYIEIWGYNEDYESELSTNYNIRKQEKLKIYKDNNLNLIEINGYEFENLSYEKIIKRFYDLLSQLVSLNPDTPTTIFYTNKSLDDKSILEILMSLSDDLDFLPRLKDVRNSDFGHLIRIIRKRHGSYFDFAKKYNKKTLSKHLDIKDIDRDIVFNSFYNFIIENKRDILDKDLKKMVYGNAIRLWLKENGGIKLNKVIFYYESIVKNKYSFELFDDMLEFVYDMRNEYKNNKCHISVKLFEFLLANEQYKYRVQKIIKNIGLFDDEDYKQHFLDVCNEPYKLTTKGFDENSFIGSVAYKNHFANRYKWHDLICEYGKEEKLNSYIVDELKKFCLTNKTTNINKFNTSHPYITANTMKHKSKQEWIDALNLSDIEKIEIKIKNYTKDEYRINFEYVKREVGNIPLSSEFKSKTKIGINSYTKYHTLKEKSYDEIVRLYCTEKEFQDYLLRKRKHKENVARKNAKPSKYSNDDLRDIFINAFEKCYKENGVYPTRRNFKQYANLDESVFRRRFNKSWNEIKEMFGY